MKRIQKYKKISKYWSIYNNQKNKLNILINQIRRNEKMTVGEAIKRQKEFVANKYDKNRSPNNELKESMKVLTKAYDELWTFLEEKHQDILDEFLMEEK